VSSGRAAVEQELSVVQLLRASHNSGAIGDRVVRAIQGVKLTSVEPIGVVEERQCCCQWCEVGQVLASRHWRAITLSFLVLILRLEMSCSSGPDPLRHRSSCYHPRPSCQPLPA
jgi:hypothetical protein